MSIVLGFVALVAAVALTWLWRQGVTERPWLETGAATRIPAPGGQAPGRAGLAIILIVAGGLFALAGSAVTMRMGYADWFEMRLPRVVWIGLALLGLSSLALQAAARAARRDDAPGLARWLGAGTAAMAAFLAAQGLAWVRLAESGQTIAATPGASFFYLISGLHVLHVVGGLLALARVALRLGDVPARAAPAIGLCAIYWHFLLVVWVAMLAILTGWAADAAELCRAILS